jgi:hypothetical protein
MQLLKEHKKEVLRQAAAMSHTISIVDTSSSVLRQQPQHSPPPPF